MLYPVRRDHCVEVEVAGEAGTPNVTPGKNHAGSISNLVSSVLATASPESMPSAEITSYKPTQD